MQSFFTSLSIAFAQKKTFLDTPVVGLAKLKNRDIDTKIFHLLNIISLVCVNCFLSNQYRKGEAIFELFTKTK